MCRDNDHGGRRCPENDSTGRRLRRKQAVAKEQYGSTPPLAGNQNPVPAPEESVTFTEAREAVEAFKARLLETRPEGVTASEWDAQLEQELVEVGYKLDACVEEEAGDSIDYSTDHFNEYWDDQYEKALAEVPYEKKSRYLEIEAFIRARAERLDVHGEDPQGLDKEYDALVEEQAALDLSWKKEALDRADKLTDEYRLQVEKDRVTAYAEASKRLVASLRPVGGIVAGLDEAPGGVREAFEESVAKDYPTEWIAASNQTRTVKFKAVEDYTLTGGHSISRTGEDTGVEHPTNLTYDFFVADFSREQWDAVWGEVSQIPGISRSKTLVRAYTDYETYMIHGNHEEVFDPKVHGAPMAGKPTGKGWEKRPTILGFQGLRVPGANATEEQKAEYFKKALQPRWVRTATSTKEEETVITIPDHTKHDPKMKNAILGIAYHEFGHQVEATYRGGLLPRMEKAFLDRRSPDAEHVISPMEVGLIRQGGFVDQYMGRVYPGRENYEVFTTGIQAIYGKSYGGLRGLSKNWRREDAEHRAFTLGCLAAL